MKKADKLILFALALLLAGALEAATCCPLTLPLWPDGIPNAKVADNREVLTTHENGDKRYSKVTQPDIVVYKAETDSPSPAVVICPGGGYAVLAYTKEGTDIAKFLASKGITGIVLKYRLPNPEFQDNPSIAPLQDAQRAIQLARENAGEWNIDPQKIGIMGFSAGGHLASTVAQQWKAPVIEGVTPRQVRPDFSILVYPVISFIQDALTHKGSRRKLVGNDASEETLLKYSAEHQVDGQTPPAFLVHSFDDRTVPVGNSMDYATALSQAGIPCEAHLYQVGGHGFGMRNPHTNSWADEMIKWIRLNFVD